MVYAPVFFTNCNWAGGVAGPAGTGIVCTASTINMTGCNLTSLYCGIRMQPDASSPPNPSQGTVIANSYFNGIEYAIISSGTFNWEVVTSGFANGVTALSINGDSAVSIVGCFFGNSGPPITISSPTGVQYPASDIYLAGNYFTVENTSYGSGGSLVAFITIEGQSTRNIYGITIRDNSFTAVGVTPQPTNAMVFDYVGGVVVDGNFFYITPTSGSMLSIDNQVYTNGSFNYQNLTFTVANNYGVNPVGALTSPPIPPSGNGASDGILNPYPYDITLNIQASTGQVNVYFAKPGVVGAQIGIMPANSNMTFALCANAKVMLVYSVKPAYWAWFGN